LEALKNYGPLSFRDIWIFGVGISARGCYADPRGRLRKLEKEEPVRTEALAVSGNAIRDIMPSKKILVTVFCFCVLVIWAIHAYVNINENESNAFRLIVLISIVSIPFVIAFIISLFKKKWFHPGIWIICFIEFIFFVIIFFAIDNTSPKYLERTNIAEKHFKSKAGFFTRYTSVLIFYDDMDSIENNKQHILKVIYRLGKKEKKNFYIGKILIDEKNQIIKEYYNQKAMSDTAFMKREFGKTLSELISIGEFFQPYR